MMNARSKARPHQHLYGSEHWRRRARMQMRIEPLCRMCAAKGKVIAAEVADHVVKHEGDVNAFYLGELQSLCRHCHESAKKQIERRGYDPTIGVDGMPVDPRHPVYQHDKRFT